MWLFLIFVAVPILEIALFIQVGGVIGLWPTLAIVVLTAFVGTTLMRTQGLAALGRLQQAMQGGGDPARPLIEGAMILVAGVLLLTPGFFTDTVGLLLLLPPVRAALIRTGAQRAMASGRFTVYTAGSPRRPQPEPAGDTIDGDYTVIDDGPSGNSGWTRR